MENITMTTTTSMVPSVTSWQHPLSATVTPVCATTALATPVQGIAVRPAAVNAFAPFAAAGAVATDVTAAKRDRAATAGNGLRGIAAHVPGSSTWSPPI